MKAFTFVSRDADGVGGCTIFELKGYIDAHTVIEFEKAVQAAIEGGCTSVILDISGLSYISSAGIGAMMGLVRKLNQLGGELVLLNPTPKVFAILDGLGFTKIFRIAGDEADALEKVKTRPA